MASRVPCPVSIALYPPLWFEGLRYSALAPTRHMFQERKSGLLSDTDFERRYASDVLGKWPTHEELLADLSRFLGANAPAGTEEVTLLCFEKPGLLCHRRFLAEWLESRGVAVPEWEAPVRQPGGKPALEGTRIKIVSEPLDI